jgi:histidine phosphotransfer protein HptB
VLGEFCGKAGAGDAPKLDEDLSEDTDYYCAVDRQTLEQLREDVDRNFESTLKKFLEKLPKRLDAIASAVKSVNPEQTSKEAHTLKGSAAILGAKKLSILCHSLEELGKSGRPPGNSDLLISILDEGQRVQVEIKKILTGMSS